MNATVDEMEAKSNNSVGCHDINVCLNKVKTFLFDMLKGDRKSVEPTSVSGERTWGKLLYEEGDILEPTDTQEMKIWPLHSTIRLIDAGGQAKVDLEQNITEMREVAARQVF